LIRDRRHETPKARQMAFMGTLNLGCTCL
jgi:hypothetical protein